MAKLKLDKESLQAFFFNHTEKIVLAVVLLALGLFIWTGSSLEGIAKSPTELTSQVDSAENHLKKDSWETIKQQYSLALDHIERKEIGDAATSESYYRLDTPLIGSPPNSATPRQDPEVFAPTDLEATVLTGALAFKARPTWADPFADLENMEQKKIEAPKKRKRRPKKKTGGAAAMYGEGMDMYGEEGAEEGDEESMYGEEMAGMYSGEMGAMGGTGAAGSSVRADAEKFPGYRPTAAPSSSGPSVIGRSVNVVSVKAIVPYQKQWDEFEQVFADAAGYMPSRDMPRYVAFLAEKAEVPSDPDAPLNWKLHTTTAYLLRTIPTYGFAAYPGELADSKYVLPGVLTMPVPPVMMRDLRGLALHSKVPLQEEVKARVIERPTTELVDINELGDAPDADVLTAGPARAVPGAMAPGAMGSGAYGTGGDDMYGEGGDEMYGEGGDDMYGEEGGGMYGSAMGGMSAQLVRGPQSEFLMIRFFDFIPPSDEGKKFVYRVQVVLEDPNHPQNPQAQPHDRILADTVRTRLAKVAQDEAKQAAKGGRPVRLSMLKSVWSEPTPPISVTSKLETYAGGVALPRMLDIPLSSTSGKGKKSAYSIPADGEPTADVMSLSWSRKYAIDLPGIVSAARGTYLDKPIEANVIDPITLVFKKLPDYPLSSGELVVDLRGGEVLEAKSGDENPLLTPGEVAIIDASGNFIVRNELDDWQVFDKYAPPPPIVVDATPAASEAYGEDAIMGAGDFENPYGE